jgi:hypothetical protein
VSQTLESVGLLVTIVLMRTFLKLKLEIEGRWPWQKAADQ